MTKREKEVEERLKKCGRTTLIKKIAKLEHELEIKESVVEMQAEVINCKLEKVVSKQTVEKMLDKASKEYERLKRNDRKGLSSVKYIAMGEANAYKKILEVGK